MNIQVTVKKTCHKYNNTPWDNTAGSHIYEMLYRLILPKKSHCVIKNQV